MEHRPLVVISDAIHPAARERLAAAAPIVDVDGLNVPALLEAVRDADALVVRSETEVSEEVLHAGPICGSWPVLVSAWTISTSAPPPGQVY